MKILYSLLYKVADGNCLLNQNRSGFRPLDSSLYQLVGLTHKIFKSLDYNPSLVTGTVYLVLSNTFEEYCMEALFKRQDYSHS